MQCSIGNAIKKSTAYANLNFEVVYVLTYSVCGYMIDLNAPESNI